MAASDNDAMYFILIFFIVLGTFLPVLQNMFNGNVIQNDVSGIIQSYEETRDQNSITIISVILGVFKMFFWTFGDIPLIIDAIVLTPIRLLFGYLVYKAVRGI